MAPLFAQLFDEEIPARFVFWDRSALGREDGPGTVVLRSARVLTRLVWSPDELGIARSFVAGDIDLDGRLFDLLETFYDGMRGARPGGGGRRTPAYPSQSRNGYPGRGPARPGSRARLLEGAVTQPERPDPARTPSGSDDRRPGPAPSGACGPARVSVGTLALRIGTLLPRCAWSARGWSGPPAAQRAHPAGSRT